MIFLILCLSLFLISLKYDNYFLFLLVVLGAIIVILSNHLFFIYLGLELQTFSSYILISKNKIKGAEAGLKYFVLGGISSGFFLLAISILLSYGYSLYLSDIYNNILILIILSLFFKLSLFPFYFWIPDIYEGSSWPVIGILLLPKISIISILIKFNYYYNNSIFIIIAILSIIIGSLGAFNQSKIKRFLAYSGIAHIGFILLSIIFYSYDICLLYLFIYIISISILLSITFYTDEFIISIIHVNNIIKITWAIVILSMAGIPPFSGFIVKFLILLITLTNNYYFSSLLIVGISIIGVSFYLRIVNILYFKNIKFNYWKNILLLQYNYSINDYYLGLFLFFIIGFKNFILW